MTEPTFDPWARYYQGTGAVRAQPDDEPPTEYEREPRGCHVDRLDENRAPFAGRIYAEGL